MGDRTQRVKGAVNETTGRMQADAGYATRRPGTEAKGSGREMKGRLQRAIGRARSAFKRSTR